MKRRDISKKDKLLIWGRDRWCCRYCGRPVIFAPAMKLLNRLAPDRGYYHAHWKRPNSPLLDELGATVDHIHPVSLGGINAHENYLTACSKCNLKKNNSPIEDWGAVVESLPTNWDGLSYLFISLYRSDEADATDREWYRLLAGGSPIIPLETIGL